MFCDKFVIPDLLQNTGFKENDIQIPEDIIKYIINTYTNNEEGVRNIKRIIEELFLKINLLKLMKNDDNNIIDIHDYKMYKVQSLLKYFSLNGRIRILFILLTCYSNVFKIFQ